FDGNRACRLRRQGRDRAEHQSRATGRPARRLGKRPRARAQRRQGDRGCGDAFTRARARDHILSNRGRSPPPPDRRYPPPRGRYGSDRLRQRDLGARSASVAGTAIYRACDRVLDKALRIAAHALECAEGDIDYGGGLFKVRGTDRSIGFADVANIAYHGVGLPPHCSPGLEVAEFYDPPDTNDPQAMHLAVVIVDPETGCVALRDLYAADDCGGPAVRGDRPRCLLAVAEDGTLTLLHAP